MNTLAKIVKYERSDLLSVLRTRMGHLRKSFFGFVHRRNKLRLSKMPEASVELDNNSNTLDQPYNRYSQKRVSSRRPSTATWWLPVRG